MAFSSSDRYNLSRIELPTPVVGDLAMWCEEIITSPNFCHDINIYNYHAAAAGVHVPNIIQVLECDHEVESPGSMTSFPERLGISDMVVPTYENDQFNQYYQLLEGEYCSGLVSNLWPVSVYPAPNHNFEIKELKTAKEFEEPTLMKVGKYSVEERKDKIMKYLKKRNQRNFNKTIKYACRKTLADKRVRVRGRFAKNNEPCEEEQQTLRKNNFVHPQEPDLFYGGCVQMKQDYDQEREREREEEEDWLEEAMSTLLYSPCILMDQLPD